MERFVAFVNNINQIYRCVQKIKNNEMTEFGLRGTHVMCIFHLNHAKAALTSARLSVICGEDKAAISRVVSELAEKDLIVFSGGESVLSGNSVNDGPAKRMFFKTSSRNALIFSSRDLNGAAILRACSRICFEGFTSGAIAFCNVLE